MDKFGNVAASSSSGGILLKQNGRVGQVTSYLFSISSYYLFIYLFMFFIHIVVKINLRLKFRMNILNKNIFKVKKNFSIFI